MHRLYALQQRISITSVEGSALLFFCALMLAGSGVRYFESLEMMPVDYAALDASFADRSAVLRASESQASETAATASPEVAEAGSRSVASGGVVAVSARRAAAAEPVRMNLNTASEQTLQRLPRVGPAIAGRIVAYRAAHGGFRSPREILYVKGIGPKTFEKIAPYIFTDAE